MDDQKLAIHYTYDLWNRLVKVEYEPYFATVSTRAKYLCNGLHWRIEKHADIDPSPGITDRTPNHDWARPPSAMTS